MPLIAASFWDLPWHPVFIHFPIAFLATTSVLVGVRHAAGRESLERFITPLLVGGVVTFPVILVTGLRDAGWSTLWREADWSQPLPWHVVSGLTTMIVSTAYAIKRDPESEPMRAPRDVGWAAATFWLLLTTGLLGGEVVYG